MEVVEEEEEEGVEEEDAEASPLLPLAILVLSPPCLAF